MHAVIILYIDNTLNLSSWLKVTFPVLNLSDFQDHLDDRCGTAAHVLLPVCVNEIAVSQNTSGKIELTKVVSCLSLAKNKGKSLARKTYLSGNTSE